MLAADAVFPATGRKVAPSAAAASAIVIAAVTVVAVVAFTARLGGAGRGAALVLDVLIRLMGFRLLVSGCFPYAHYSAVSGGHSLETSGPVKAGRYAYS